MTEEQLTEKVAETIQLIDRIREKILHDMGAIHNMSEEKENN